METTVASCFDDLDFDWEVAPGDIPWSHLEEDPHPLQPECQSPSFSPYSSGTPSSDNVSSHNTTDVINGEAGPAKGRRSSRKGPRDRPVLVCFNCRNRRKKCDRQQPVCGQCRALGQDHLCKWDERRNTIVSKKKNARKSSHAILLRHQAGILKMSAAVSSERLYFEATIGVAGRVIGVGATFGVSIAGIRESFDEWTRFMRYGRGWSDVTLPTTVEGGVPGSMGLLESFMLLSAVAHASLYMNFTTSLSLCRHLAVLTVEEFVMLMPHVFSGDVALTPELLGSICLVGVLVEHLDSTHIMKMLPVYRGLYDVLSSPSTDKASFPDYYTAMCSCIFFSGLPNPWERTRDLVFDRLEVTLADKKFAQDLRRVRGSVVSSLFTLEVLCAPPNSTPSGDYLDSFLFLFKRGDSGDHMASLMLDGIKSEALMDHGILQKVFESGEGIPPNVCRVNFTRVCARGVALVVGYINNEPMEELYHGAVDVLEFLLTDFENTLHPFNLLPYQVLLVAMRVVSLHDHAAFRRIVQASGVIGSAAAVYGSVLSKRGRLLYSICNGLMASEVSPELEAWVRFAEGTVQ